jgi:protein-L-isoaspartate(D-aspartate) O-methyltransferase
LVELKRMTLIDSLIKDGWLKTSRIIKAFQKIKRVDFLPDEMKDLAELNEALPIGYGQTISQPLVVAFMLEQLQAEPGDKVLDIGSGSGWTTALLADIVGEKGKVIGIEVVPGLKRFGEENVAKYNFVEKGIVSFVCDDGSEGYKKEAPFDRILVSAAAVKVPEVWKEQLKIEGRIVTPMNSSIWLLIKKSSIKGKEVFEEYEYPGFVFVPLICRGK